ncbi:MAG: 4Fe-4S binding protein [Candidatus Cloacimonetes bacterium]|jgi:Fe-S-cluster-containing hydrogenase component 2|nr:4Fe-4S binding protein [Candidatus Cloacimonadota bacterium]MDD4157053.1 4Fe-4S binding protein [Candidatus Cloacimonadota bacterium]
MKVDKNLCDVCGTCASVCPVGAIIIREFDIVINNEKCIKCNKCIRVCPAQAITEE